MGTLITIPEAERVEGSIRRAVVDGPAVAVSSAGDWESAIAQALGGGRDDRHQDRHPARPTLVKEDRQ